MKFSSFLALLFGAATLLTTPALATSHMPQCKGAVVYAVPADRVYYTKHTSMYGHAKGGTYMCEAAANAKGYKKAGETKMGGSKMKKPN